MNVPSWNVIALGAAGLLIGCGDRWATYMDEFPQDWFLTATQETLDTTWKTATVEFFDEDTKAQLSNLECSVDPKTSHEWVLPTYYVIDDTKEAVIVCVFPNE